MLVTNGLSIENKDWYVGPQCDVIFLPFSVTYLIHSVTISKMTLSFGNVHE